VTWVPGGIPDPYYRSGSSRRCSPYRPARRHDEVLRRAVGVQLRDHVLDIGCGTGQTTRQAARTARAGSAFGVDVSAPAIKRARELARTEGLRNVTFEHADAQVHGFPPARFDLAMSRFGTMFFDDPVAAFANIGRALRPAGRLVDRLLEPRPRPVHLDKDGRRDSQLTGRIYDEDFQCTTLATVGDDAGISAATEPNLGAMRADLPLGDDRPAALAAIDRTGIVQKLAGVCVPAVVTIARITGMPIRCTLFDLGRRESWLVVEFPNCHRAEGVTVDVSVDFQEPDKLIVTV
jgi:SAM-dependent methyltransferase